MSETNFSTQASSHPVSHPISQAFTPVIIGNGRAGKAILKALYLLQVEHPSLQFSQPMILPRDLDEAEKKLMALQSKERTVLIIANPHGLHAETFSRLSPCGAAAVILEKPACTSLQEIEKFKTYSMPVAICHGYRMSWGIQKLKQLLNDPASGKIFSIEGRYWQSSVAQKALLPGSAQKQTWKNDQALNGPYDVLLDLGTHLFDLSTFLAGTTSFDGSIQLNFVNSAGLVRDTHVNYDLKCDAPLTGLPISLRGSISKTAHGFGNELQLFVLTDLKSFEWNFSNPDQISIGRGDLKEVISRTQPMSGSGLAPFHGAGWLEGYVEMWRALLIKLDYLKETSETPSLFPRLEEHLQVLDSLFTRVKIEGGTRH